MTTTELIADLKTSRAKVLRSDDPSRKSDGEVEILLSTDHVIEHLERLDAEIERLRAENAELRENGKLVCEALRRAKNYER